MTPNQFRHLALAFPGAIEGAHRGHAGFRVGGKIFATLGYPDDTSAVVMVKPDQQALMMGLASDQPVQVDDTSFIATSFPGFVETMRALGADLS